ncbi:MAG: DUF1819 family protein [Gemmatimonadetes bacterium]|nr:DUF1819 family protein [Gemmatimonadota bacterium]
MNISMLAARSAGSGATIPGLDRNARYSSRLSARSALYSDFHQLMASEDRPLASAEYRRRVVDENRLAKRSVAAREKLWSELKARYLLDAGEPLFAEFWSEWRRCDSDMERSLTAYVLFALNDRLVSDLGTEYLFPLLRRAPAEIRLVDVEAFIHRRIREHPASREWTDNTRLAVAQKYLASIRDFGLARGTMKKLSLRPALYAAPVRLVVRALRIAGVPELEILGAHAFRLLCIAETEVIEALSELHRGGTLLFRVQGDVVELDVGGA